jgi:hypothetical protein
VNWVVVDGDVVAVDGLDGSVHTMTGATAVVWQLLDGEPLDGTAELVAEAFGIAVDQARVDIDTALEQILEADLALPT